MRMVCEKVCWQLQNVKTETKRMLVESYTHLFSVHLDGHLPSCVCDLAAHCRGVSMATKKQQMAINLKV